MKVSGVKPKRSTNVGSFVPVPALRYSDVAGVTIGMRNAAR